jgi:RNA polymerase sigma-70 factor (ECF subfamily)
VSDLALAAADGDRAALHDLVRTTQPQVWRFCAYLGGRRYADDLTQDVYLRALRNLSKFRGEATATTWLLAIARCVVADHQRALSRRRRLAAAVQPTREASTPETSGELDAALASLAVERRSAFVLTQMIGLSYQEAAAVCACPVGTIRSRVARARTDLITFLSDSEDRLWRGRFADRAG